MRQFRNVSFSTTSPSCLPDTSYLLSSRSISPAVVFSVSLLSISPAAVFLASLAHPHPHIPFSVRDILLSPSPPPSANLSSADQYQSVYISNISHLSLLPGGLLLLTYSMCPAAVFSMSVAITHLVTDSDPSSHAPFTSRDRDRECKPRRTVYVIVCRPGKADANARRTGVSRHIDPDLAILENHKVLG